MGNKDTLHLNNGSQQSERFARTNAPEVRGERGSEQDAARTEDHGLSEDEFQAFLETESLGTRLPRPPEIPGWHMCWLTTQSQYDTIQNRMRFGYQLVRCSELPNFDPSNGQSLVGHEGIVSCNEMVLGKIRVERYQQMMQYFHYQKPMQDQEGLAAQIKKSAEDSSGRQLLSVETDGGRDGIHDMEESARTDKRKVPTFAP